MGTGRSRGAFLAARDRLRNLVRGRPNVAASAHRRYSTLVRRAADARFVLRAALVAVTAWMVGGCPHPKEPPPVTTPTTLVAQPASGDFDWSIDETRHPLRAGAAFFGAGGALDLVLADAEVSSPCDATKLALDPEHGVERVRVPQSTKGSV